MNSPHSTFAVLFTFAVLAALAGGAYLFLQDIHQFLQTLDRQVAASILAGLASALYLGLSIRRAGQVKGLQRLRLRKKSESYERFLVASASMSAEQGGDDLREVASAEIRAATGDLLLWAGAGVIKQLAAYRRVNPRMDISDPASRASLEQLLRAMRTDLGENNLGLGEADLTGLLSLEGIDSTKRFSKSSASG